MYISLFIIFFIALLVYKSYTKPVRILFMFDSDQKEIQLSATWLPLFRLDMKVHQMGTHITIFVFHLKLISRALKKKKKADRQKRKRQFLKALALTDARIIVNYGFLRPDLTGMLFGVVSMIDSLVPVTKLVQVPEFIPSHAYFRITGKINLNAAKTIISIIQLRKKKERGKSNMEQQNLTENVDSLFHSLENFTQKEGIIGKPVTQGDKTFMPIVSITVGYGGGNASLGKGQQGQTAGMGAAGAGTGALGLGAKLSTDAVLVIDGQNVSLLPINSNASSLMDKIPQIVSSINQNKKSGTPAQ